MVMSEVKLKLLCHPRVDAKSRVSDDLLLHPRDNHGILPGNIIELKHPDVPHPILFLVKSLREDFPHRDVISVEQSLSQSLKLQPYKTVSVRVVSKEDVILDLVEINFRDQYFGRRDLMELSNIITNTIVQRNTMIEFGVMRGYVGELWRKGESTSCGYISDRTKIVFRSFTATYHIFIQMSREMWHFDEFGDLFFEKSVKFLRELILKSWMNSFCTHDVTLVLATRAFINAPGIEIPRKGIFLRNSDGQIYADFYKVIIQTERYSHEEWKRNFSQLMLAFKRYQSDIKNFILKYLPGVKDPSIVSVRLSAARETNLLEGLNLVLSDYECYNVDRKFDQTGKACIMISPGCGVFDASRDMISFTKQRALDLGVTVDLVCLGHQPLHAVPLFVCRDLENPESPEVCIVPHWINHSYFRSSREIYALNHTETVTRINVKAKRVVNINPLLKATEELVVEDRESNPPSYHSLQGQTSTSLVLPDQSEASRQCTVSFNDGLPIQSSAVMVERPMEGVISASEIGSYDSVSSAQGWNTTVNFRSRTQSSLCSEQQSPPSANMVSFLPEKPSWMTLYGYADVESTSSNGVFPRNTLTLTEGSLRRLNQTIQHQDLSHSYQSGCNGRGGANFPHHGLGSRPSKTVLEGQTVTDVPIGGSASSWQPTRDVGVVRHLPPVPRRRSIAKKSSARLKLTAAAIMGAAFRTFPFGIHPQIFGLNKTVSQRRWAYLHSPAQRMPLIEYDRAQSMKLLEDLRPKINLAKVWHAYFDFHRHVVETLMEVSASKNHTGGENLKHLSTNKPNASKLPIVQPEDGGEHLSKEMENVGLENIGLATLPFIDPPIKFANSAVWRALCEVVDSPNLVQTCAPASADIISPLEAESLEKAFPSEQLRDGSTSSSLSPASQHRRLLKEMIKPLGIDWKSLTTPALLPLTTEYFPEASSLLGEDFMIHEYRVVLNILSEDEWKLHFDTKVHPGVAYSRHPLSSRQVLEEIVAQRIAQGFQLLIEKDSVHAISASNSSSPDVKSLSSAVALSDAKNIGGHLPTRMLSTSKRSVLSHSAAFRLRHQADNQQGGKTVRDLQDRPGLIAPPPLVPHSRTNTVTGPFGGPSSSAIRKVPPKSKNFRLSTGSIFHTVTLQPDETITVTKYQAKRTQKIENFVSTYRYILQVPASHCYLPMEITLKNRMQLAFNWSYLDNLVSTHGVHESYELSPAIKFWRSRYLILPGLKETTRKLVEELREAKTTGNRVRCDVYETPLSLLSYDKLCDRFIAFLESINRIRRINVPQRTRQRHPTTPNDPSMTFNWSEAMEQPRPRRDSLTTTTSSGTPSTTSAHVRRSELVSTPSIDLESGSEVGPAIAAIHSAATTPVQQPPPSAPPVPPPQLYSVASHSAVSSSSCTSSAVLPLSTLSDMAKIVAALLDPEYGLSYMDGSIPLPKHTFCSYDLTNWLTRNLIDVVSLDVASKYAQTLLDAGYICHSSGNRTHKFLNGFFFYTLLAEISESPNIQDSSDTPPSTTQSRLRSSFEHRPIRPVEIRKKGSRGSAGEIMSYLHLDIERKVSDRKSASGDPLGLSKPADIRKISFPTTYLPPGSDSPLGIFSTDFQKEWIEVLLVRNTSPPTNSSIASTFFPCSSSRPLNSSMESGTTSTEDQKNHLTNGILSSVRLNRVFGSSNSPEIHVGSDGVLRKRVTRDLRDSSNTSTATQALKEHPEWYCLLYDLNYHPACAFGVEIQWLVASPSRLNEMLLHFLYYKATSHGFSIVPAPCHPFGYSGTRYSMYPLRVPIFIPCGIYDLFRARNGIPKGKSEPLPGEVAAELFPELPESEHMVALFYFQERILSRFGFIPLSYSPAVQQQSPVMEVADGSEALSCPPPCGDEPPKGMSYTQRMFVHIYGGMFAMVPMYPHGSPKKQMRESFSPTHPVTPNNSPIPERKESGEHLSDHATPRRASTNNYPPSSCSYATTLCSDNETPGGTQDANLDSIHSTGTLESQSMRRPVLERKTSCFEIQTEVGFFWMWNHMLPRRWRGQTTVEEIFDLGMLEDLRLFCSGGAYEGIEDNRLLETLDEFRSTLCTTNKIDTPKQTVP